MNKLIGLFALVAVVVGNDLAVGPIGGNKVFDEKVEASPAIWRQVKNVTVNATEGHVISRVVITDLREGKDGSAEIVDGGEGHENVTIELKSPAVFRGFEFNIEVFAVSDNKHAVTGLTAHETNENKHEVNGPKSHESRKTEYEPKVPVSVASDASDDNLRKIRKTEGDKDVPTEVPVTSDATVSVTASDYITSTTPKDEIPKHEHQPKVPVSVATDEDNLRKIRKPEEDKDVTAKVPATIDGTTVTVTASHLPAASTTPKDDSVKINIGKEPTTNKPEKVESDIIDPLAVQSQPTHMNSSDAKTEKPESGLKTPERNVRRTEEVTTEAVISTTGYESTTGQESTDLTTQKSDDEIPPFSWNVNLDKMNPIYLGSPKETPKIEATHPAMVPIPYNH